MDSLLWKSIGRAAAVLTIGVAVATSAVAAELDGLKIIAPAGPGGGWDQTARAMQEAMRQNGIATGVQVTNIPGAGGTIGLAQFATANRGDGNALLVGGLVMVGAVLTNNSPVTLDRITPIARLTGEYEVIVVPAASDIRTLDQLVERFRENPGAVAWAGGSAGGTDHILVGLIGKEIGVDPAGINYVPFSGGGEALAALLGNHVTAGVSGYGEFAGQIAAGELRALAISAPERLEGIDVPTLKEQGIDVELVNWRGVMGAPDLTDEERQRLIDGVGAMVASDTWQNTLKQRDWMDLYLAGDAFAEFLANDREQVEGVLRDIGLVQ